ALVLSSQSAVRNTISFAFLMMIMTWIETRNSNTVFCIAHTLTPNSTLVVVVHAVHMNDPTISSSVPFPVQLTLVVTVRAVYDDQVVTVRAVYDDQSLYLMHIVLIYCCFHADDFGVILDTSGS